jgi:hypothetical protein
VWQSVVAKSKSAIILLYLQPLLQADQDIYDRHMLKVIGYDVDPTLLIRDKSGRVQSQTLCERLNLLCSSENKQGA